MILQADIASNSVAVADPDGNPVSYSDASLLRVWLLCKLGYQHSSAVQLHTLREWAIFQR